MFEIIDTAVTNALTAMVYGVPALVTIAFIHFVATHPAPQQDEFFPSTSVQEPQTAADSQKLIVQPIERQEVVPVANLPEPIVAAVECAPVDWTLWKVADLRDKAIRKVFNIQGQQNRQKLKKQALIDRYKSAFAGGFAANLQALD
ncbi:hypothetical protein [cf. Phormidesmis sp. LEGE 11477]|uniref:hypothetical protein n=1 Tax=cf. Phormidesmis sp. LEGE 11477 TaxID=1828680 RepID=UPI001882274A|nr:hypothetical protein [cf. Phormidesmis sp. LEGE 11477]MBE9060354.1 hypothetical protein [cf. Phormidesmis sp. LEGE 11477]